MTARLAVRVQREDFDLKAEVAALAAASGDVGAVVTFTGLCRDEGGTLQALELEHYPGMAEAEIRRIAEEAAARWPVAGITVVHRVGLATSAHRQAAFDAAGFVMDFLKSQAPFWKKEHRTDARDGAWVEARRSDDEALGRWRPAGRP